MATTYDEVIQSLNEGGFVPAEVTPDQLQEVLDALRPEDEIFRLDIEQAIETI
jgi:hypothetical protein